MANAIEHATIASLILSGRVAHPADPTDHLSIATAQAHAQTSRAWSAIGRDQAVVEARERAAAHPGQVLGHDRPGRKAGAK